MSAEQRAGAKTPGRVSGEVCWYGSQGGRVPLGDRQVRLRRPRLRDHSGEVAIPVVEAAQAAMARLAERKFDELAILARKRRHRDLWILAQALGRTEHKVDRQTKAA